MNRLFAICCALFGAAILVAAPVPKTPKDSRKESGAAEPVEPAIDMAKLADNPVLRFQDAANRTKSTNNLKQIALAFHAYHDVNGRLPADVVDKDGQPILSWRVLILPYLEQNPLYQEFKLDEPWNGPNNSKLLEKMPKIFESPRIVTKKKGYAAYQGFSGDDALFRPGKPAWNLPGITDGCSNTIMVLETSSAVPWTRPADIPFDPKKDLRDIGKAYGQKPMAAMCDGSVRALDLKKISAETLKGAITPSGGEVLGKDWEE
jgi:Protein of unknown function (DUF1559)